LRLIITDTGGGTFTIHDFNAESIFPLLESWNNDTPLLHFNTDDGTSYIPKRAVARIDALDSEETHLDPINPADIAVTVMCIVGAGIAVFRMIAGHRAEARRR
jgi:hypothetical protein